MINITKEMFTADSYRNNKVYFFKLPVYAVYYIYITNCIMLKNLSIRRGTSVYNQSLSNNKKRHVLRRSVTNDIYTKASSQESQQFVYNGDNISSCFRISGFRSFIFVLSRSGLNNIYFDLQPFRGYRIFFGNAKACI